MEKIEITKVRDEFGSTSLTVRCGDQYETHLGNDEALWCVVSFLTGRPMRYLQTQAEHDVWNAKYRPQEVQLEPWQKLLPVTIPQQEVEAGEVVNRPEYWVTPQSLVDHIHQIRRQEGLEMGLIYMST